MQQEVRQAILATHPFHELESYGAWEPWTSAAGENYYRIFVSTESATLKADVQTLFPICQQKYSNLGLVDVRQSVKAAFFDMDATCIAEESLNTIAAAYGVLDSIQNVTAAAMRGELDFEASVRTRLRHLKGCSHKVIEQVAASLTLNPNIQSLTQRLKQEGVLCHLITGGFTDLAAPVAERLSMHAYHANEFAYDAVGQLNGELGNQHVVDAQAKADWLKSQCTKIGIQPHETVAVGDGANDLLMLQIAGLAVGYSPKEVLFPDLDAVNYSGDHMFLHDLLRQRGET